MHETNGPLVGERAALGGGVIGCLSLPLAAAAVSPGLPSPLHNVRRKVVADTPDEGTSPVLTVPYPILVDVHPGHSNVVCAAVVEIELGK
jgi:hypothetical protein